MGRRVKFTYQFDFLKSQVIWNCEHVFKFQFGYVQVLLAPPRHSWHWTKLEDREKEKLTRLLCMSDGQAAAFLLLQLSYTSMYSMWLERDSERFVLFIFMSASL